MFAFDIPTGTPKSKTGTRLQILFFGQQSDEPWDKTSHEKVLKAQAMLGVVAPISHCCIVLGDVMYESTVSGTERCLVQDDEHLDHPALEFIYEVYLGGYPAEKEWAIRAYLNELVANNKEVDAKTNMRYTKKLAAIIDNDEFEPVLNLNLDEGELKHRPDEGYIEFNPAYSCATMAAFVINIINATYILMDCHLPATVLGVCILLAGSLDGSMIVADELDEE